MRKQRASRKQAEVKVKGYLNHELYFADDYTWPHKDPISVDYYC